MSRPIGKHSDGSNCYTRNCSLEHQTTEKDRVKQLQTKINNTLNEVKKPSPQIFRSLEYGTDDYNFFRSKAEAAEETITGDEYRAVNEYTGWAFKHYYGFMEGTNRDGTEFGSNLEEPLRSQLTTALTKGITHIDAFITKSGTFPKPITVYRGEKPPHGVTVTEHLSKTFQIGSTVQVKRYLSTSMDAKIASEIVDKTPESYILVITTKEGAMLGENISEQGLREKEVLLPRNREYKVKNINTSIIQYGSTKKTHTTVHLEMI